jgi:class 3 adenylate cyclase/tetratricopeptide (TPR) repeat protein
MLNELASWLEKIGLGQYAATFLENDIDLAVLPELSDADLQSLGLSLGHRRRLQRAVAEISTRPERDEATAGEAPGAQETPHREAERRQIAVLFCDLVGSTELSRRHDPEDFRELMRRYQDAVSGAVVRHGGYVANFLGDGIVAYFGWPRAGEDDATDAVRAALDAVAAVDALSLRARAGIASGMVVVGDLDAAGRRQVGAIAGETPNLAARLQSLAAPGEVVIAGLTRQLVGGTFILEELGPQQLKGIADPVPAWRVVGESAVESRFEARVGQLTELVGREQEIALLIERFERANAGEGQALLLSGEAGIGKSRLIQALYERLETAAEPPVWIRMQCAPFYAASALQPVIRHLRQAAGFRAEDTPDEKLDKFEALLRQSSTDIGRSAALLAPLLALPTERYESLADLTPAQRDELLLQALVEKLLGRASRRTVLFVLEDAHWIDPATRDLIERLLAAIAGARILVLITYRPEFSAEWTRHPHVGAMTLNRLSRGQGAAFVRAAGGGSLPDVIVALIGERAGGVPLFIEELTRSALETGSAFADSIPETLQASLLARLDRLGAEPREIAQLAAAIGREFQLDLLSAVAGKPTEAIVAAVERLAGAQIVLPAGAARSGGYIFRHALIQEAAYQSLLLSRRRDHHREVARVLENGRTDWAEPEVIAQHYTAASLPERALPHWLEAGRQALARFAVAAAVAHFERGLRLARELPEAKPQRLALLLALADALSRTERARTALDAFYEAAALAREVGSPEDLAQAALGAEEQEIYGGGQRASVELLEAALHALGPGETVMRCRVLSQLGRALLDTGDAERAEAMSRVAIAMARRLGDPRALYDALICERPARAGRPYPAAQFPEARRIIDEMTSAAERIGDPILVVRALGRSIPTLLEMGDRTAFEILARLDESLEPLGLSAHVYFNISVHALQAILEGEFIEAERLAERALEHGRAAERSFGRERTTEFASGVYGVQMFTIRREQGRLAEVAPVLRRFIDEKPSDAAWRPGMALIASDLGFHEAARKAFDDLAAGGFAFPVDAKRSLTLSYLAEVCARLADAERAALLYDLLLPYRDLAIIAPVSTVCCGSAGRFLGMLARTFGNWVAAEGHFEAALDMDERLNAWPWLAHSKYEYAVMLRERGRPQDRDRAETLLASAAASAERIRMPRLQQNIHSLVR